LEVRAFSEHPVNNFKILIVHRNRLVLAFPQFSHLDINEQAYDDRPFNPNTTIAFAVFSGTGAYTELANASLLWNPSKVLDIICGRIVIYGSEALLLFVDLRQLCLSSA
jgi:hypothetical protein